MNCLMSIKREYWLDIASGKKTVELRKYDLPKDYTVRSRDWIYIVETGDGGCRHVVGRIKVSLRSCHRKDYGFNEWYASLDGAAAVPIEWARDYFGVSAGGAAVMGFVTAYAWQIDRVTVFDVPKVIPGGCRPPQMYTLLWDGKVKLETVPGSYAKPGIKCDDGYISHAGLVDLMMSKVPHFTREMALTSVRRMSNNGYFTGSRKPMPGVKIPDNGKAKIFEYDRDKCDAVISVCYGLDRCKGNKYDGLIADCVGRPSGDKYSIDYSKACRLPADELITPDEVGGLLKDMGVAVSEQHFSRTTGFSRRRCAAVASSERLRPYCYRRRELVGEIEVSMAWADRCGINYR